MIPVTVRTPDTEFTMQVSQQSLKPISDLAECPGPKEDGYSVSYIFNDHQYVFTPVLPKVITHILQVYQEGGFE